MIHTDRFMINEGDNIVSYGCQQAFYGTKWKRLSGCGPTAASNLILYQQLKDHELPEIHIASARHLMNALWTFITPGIGGVNSTAKFEKGLKRYLHEHELDLEVHVLDVPKKQNDRPSLEAVKTFIFEALQQETAIAFLNLHKGETHNLDEWHWVTIVAASYDAEKSSLSVSILDDGKKFEIDLGLWLKTTRDKGGFVVCLPK